MAKLSGEFLERGRACVRAHDIHRLIRWIEESRVPIQIDVARKTFRECFRDDRTDRALRIFDAYFLMADPVVDRIVLYVKMGLWLAFLVSLIGVVLYFLWHVAQFAA